MLLPKISIITVVFNGAKTLEETIKSVLTQTYQNIEFIVVDGGSIDGTIDILKRYNPTEIVWQSEPDKGIYDAMNKGIKMANGEWLYFLGADDTFYNKNVLEEIFSTQDRNQYDLLYGNVYSLALKRKYDGEFDSNRLFFQNICHQAIFYKKGIHRRVGLYNDKFTTFADWNLNIECFLHPEIRIRYLDIIISNFAAGGLGTSQPDLLFLRSSLFPANIKSLNKNGIKSLNNIKFYDKWWRLLRSLRLNKKEDNIRQFSIDEKLPAAIEKMYHFQKQFPYKILRIGIFSKLIMVISYCKNRLNF